MEHSDWRKNAGIYEMVLVPAFTLGSPLDLGSVELTREHIHQLEVKIFTSDYLLIHHKSSLSGSIIEMIPDRHDDRRIRDHQTELPGKSTVTAC